MKPVKARTCIGALLAVAFAPILSSCGQGPLFDCDTTITNTVASEDVAFKAGVVAVQCGATTPKATWIVLAPMNREFDLGSDRIATFEGNIKHLSWTDNSLLVDYGDATPFLRKGDYLGVNIEYHGN